MSVTYLGTIDDVVARFPWGYKANRNFLNRTLVKAALFGNPIILNDGYLINLPAARTAIMHPKSSPLMALILAGFVQVASRTGDLTTTAKEMDKEGVTSFGRALRSRWYKGYEPKLGYLTQELSKLDTLKPWPDKDLGAGFKATLLHVVDKSPTELGMRFATKAIIERAFEGFLERVSEDNRAARTRWEEAAEEVVDGFVNWRFRRKTLSELMHLANEAYHINFSGCLSATTMEQTCVETRHSPAFYDLLEANEPQSADFVSKMPVTIPRGFPFRRVDLLTRVVKPDTEIGQAKLAYQSSLQDYMNQEIDIESFLESLKSYQRMLSQHFFEDLILERWRLGIESVIRVSFHFAEESIDPSWHSVKFAFAMLMFYIEKAIPPFVINLLKLREKSPLREFVRRETLEGSVGPLPLYSHSMVTLPIADDAIADVYEPLPSFN